MPFTQEPLAQIQSSDNKGVAIVQEPLAQIQDVAQTVAAVYRMPIEDMEKLFLASPVARINWASHVIMLNSSLPLGVGYWYMKQSVEMGWSSNVLKMQIESKLYERQINSRKVNNFTATLPVPQSDLANYLLKDPYIFDLAGAKERADERDIEEQLVKHVTRYLLEMGNGFAFVARQKHFQIGDSDFYADLILYNIKLHAYVVVELKATPFKPEYAGQELRQVKSEIRTDKLKGAATDAATVIISGVGSLFGGGKMKKLELSNEELRQEIAKRDKGIDDLKVQMQHMQEQHGKQIRNLQGIHNLELEAKDKEISRLNAILEKAFKWFPMLKEMLRMEKLCTAIGFTKEMIESLLTKKEAIRCNGRIYSEEHRRKFDIRNDIFKVEKNPTNDSKLVLTINRQPIGEWFKEQWEKLRQGLRKTEEPRKSRGFKL